MSFSCIPVISRRPPRLTVEVSNTRKDWRIRRPGEFGSMAFELKVASNGSVAVLFDGFEDLHRSPSAGCPADGALPTWYAQGDTWEQAQAAGWVPADDFNQRWLQLDKSPQLQEGRILRFWQRLTASEDTRSCEYEDQATVVFILSRFHGMGVVPDPSGAPSLAPRPQDLALPPLPAAREKP